MASRGSVEAFVGERMGRDRVDASPSQGSMIGSLWYCSRVLVRSMAPGVVPDTIIHKRTDSAADQDNKIGITVAMILTGLLILVVFGLVFGSLCRRNYDGWTSRNAALRDRQTPSPGSDGYDQPLNTGQHEVWSRVPRGVRGIGTDLAARCDLGQDYIRVPPMAYTRYPALAFRNDLEQGIYGAQPVVYSRSEDP
jgi:hypothetical protein